MVDSARGWYSRGYLPHLDASEIVQSVTFRLADAVPADVVAEWRDELRLAGTERPTDARVVELRKRIERYADAGHGACWLSRPDVAEVVEASLLHFDGSRYRIIAWCIMPNHVHVVTETLPGFPLSTIVRGWKSFTARVCNRLLDRSGTFWMRDYFDRFIRDESHLQAAVQYAEYNPVEAGLCTTPEQWRWSSARRRER